MSSVPAWLALCNICIVYIHAEPISRRTKDKLNVVNCADSPFQSRGVNKVDVVLSSFPWLYFIFSFAKF